MTSSLSNKPQIPKITRPQIHIPDPSPRVTDLRGRRQLTQSYYDRAKMIVNEPRHQSSPIEYLLVRHGESEANVDASLYSTVPDHAVRLSKRGEEQAREAGQQIKKYFEDKYGKKKEDWKCRIWTSTYKRTRQTASLIQEEAGDWITDIKESIFLVEQQFGLFEGVDWANGSVDQIFPQELAHYNKCATFGGRFWARVPMGESRFDVCRRVYHILKPILEDDSTDHVILVSHGVTLRAFVLCYFNKTPEWFEEEPNPSNCSIRLISGENEKYIWPKEEENQKSTVPDPDLLLLKQEIDQIRTRIDSMILPKLKT